MIGIIDQDAMYYPKRKRLNLEVMKIASYHDSKKQVIKLITNPEELESYSKIYLRREKQMDSKPSYFTGTVPVEWGGLSFTNNIYVPLNPLEMEFAKPKPQIYYEYLKDCYDKGIYTEKEIKHIYSCNYFRLFAGNTPCPENTLIPGYTVMLYDNDFTQKPDWYDHFASMHNIVRSVHLYSPLVVKSIDDFEKLLSFKNLCYPNYGITLDVFLDFNSFKRFIRQYKDTLLTRWKLVFLYFYSGKNYLSEFYTEDWYRANLLVSLKKILFAASNGVDISFKFFERKYYGFYDPIFRAMHSWTSRNYNYQTPYYDFCRKYKPSAYEIITEEIMNQEPEHIKKLFLTSRGEAARRFIDFG